MRSSTTPDLISRDVTLCMANECRSRSVEAAQSKASCPGRSLSRSTRPVRVGRIRRMRGGRDPGPDVGRAGRASAVAGTAERSARLAVLGLRVRALRMRCSPRTVPQVARRDEVAFIADRVASGRAYRRNEQTQTVSRVTASPLAAEKLGVAPDSDVYARARLVKEGEQPTHTLTSYYRPERVEGTRLVDPAPGPAGKGGGYKVLYDAGYEIDHMKESLFVRVATAEESKLLQLPSGEPVMELHRITYTADGTVVEFAVGVHAASRFAWEHDFEVPDSAQPKDNA
jgi:hypothetical protein